MHSPSCLPVEPSMLITHPRIYLDASGAKTDALLIRNGRIAATGDDARAATTSDDERHRPDGRCLFPALGDAHIHLWGLGLRAGAVDLRGMDADEALTALSQATSTTDEWIFANNLDEHHFAPDQHITRHHLDRVFDDRPVCIYRVDRHALWVNSEALRRADFDDRYQPDEGGHVPRDADGTPTGYLVDRAMEPVLSTIPETTLDEDRRVFFESSARLRDCGVGFATIARSSVDHVEMLEAVDADQRLPLHLDVLVAGTDKRLDRRLQQGPDARGKAGLQIAGIKFYADGAMGSKGARLRHRYKGGGTGLRMHPEGWLRRRIPELMNQQWQVAVHAIGDAAAAEVLDAFDAAEDQHCQSLRPRLEHAQMLTDEDVDRLLELGVVASIQPIHMYSDAPWAPELLSNKQLRCLFRWRDLVDAPLAAGSDYPIDDLNPWHGIATAVSRRHADGSSFFPDQALSTDQALAAYTSGAAYASHRQEQLGCLHPGFLAEIIAVDTDPFEATPDEIWTTRARFVHSNTDRPDYNFFHSPSSTSTR